MNQELSQNEYNGLEDYLKPYFEANEGGSYRLKNELPSSTNSNFGSYHWFMTIIGFNKQIGDCLQEQTPNEETIRAWGEQLSNSSEAMLAWFRLYERQTSPDFPNH